MPDKRDNQGAVNLIKNMSHDVRGSLVTMSVIIKMLKREKKRALEESVLGKLDELETRLLHLIGIVEDYVNVAISLGEDAKIERNPLDLKQQVIDPILEELRLEIAEHHVNIKEDLPSSGATGIKANETLLKSVYRNLFKNAIRYGGDGATIAYGVVERGSHHQLNVYNTGEPLPSEVQNNLFKQGYSQSGQGLGIGLNMVQKIVEAHGGNIRYEPRENGSNFVFTLPK